LKEEGLVSLQIDQASPTHQIFYPETDGKPMAESDLHRKLTMRLINLLQRFFVGQRVYVSGNLLLYYEEGNRYKSVAPDCFIVLGLAQTDRRAYQTWVEGKVPEVVFEVSSKSTQREDFGKKMRLYADLGVREYFIYDPTGDYLDPQLVAFELQGGGYVPMQPTNEALDLGPLAFAPGEEEMPEFISTALGLRLALDDEKRLQLFDLSTHQRLLTDEEALHEAQAENERLRTELARLRGGKN
jgi:hypothetical protein